MSKLSIDLTNLTNIVNGGSGSGATLVGPYVSVQGNSRLHVVIQLDASAEDITVTPEQAQDDIGDGLKALEIPYYYSKFGTETEFTKTIVESNTMLIANDTAGVVVVEFDVSRLDVNNEFSHVRVLLTDSTTRKLAMVFFPMGGNA